MYHYVWTTKNNNKIAIPDDAQNISKSVVIILDAMLQMKHQHRVT
jgi:hypothetical protein